MDLQVQARTRNHFGPALLEDVACRGLGEFDHEGKKGVVFWFTVKVCECSYHDMYMSTCTCIYTYICIYKIYTL